MQPLLRDVYASVPAIVMTGAAWWDRRTHRYLNTSYIYAPVAARVAETCRRRGINPFVYTLPADIEAPSLGGGMGGACGGIMQVYHNGRLNPAEQAFVDQRIHLTLKHFNLDTSQGEALYIPGTTLMFAIGPREQIFAAADEIRAGGGCYVSSYIDIFGADTGILEVYDEGVSKAAAVKRMAEVTGAERIVVFGDNLNDIPMMQVADLSFAVANAQPQVKAAATEVIGRNTDDAVALTIEKIFRKD